tara:strand:+ start:845 stop:979 length:135 start_codon:yes stop_codon:yes gene_type:complete
MLILKVDKVSCSHQGVETNKQQAIKKIFKGSKQATSNQQATKRI